MKFQDFLEGYVNQHSSSESFQYIHVNGSESIKDGELISKS